MGNFAEPSDKYASWSGSVPKLETTTPVLGGEESAPLNAPHLALHNRISNVMQHLSDTAGLDLTASDARAHARKAAELYRLFGNRMFAGTPVTSPANNTVRLPTDSRILVGGYWFEPSSNLEKNDLPNSSGGGLYLHRTGFDAATHKATWELLSGGADGVGEFSWTNGLRAVADADKFFVCNWATSSGGVVTLTNTAKPLKDDDLAMPIGMPVPWIKKGSSDVLPPNWIALTGGTVDEPRSPFDNATLPNLNGKFLRGDTNANQVGAIPSGGADSHSHGANTALNVTAGSAPSPDAVIENNNWSGGNPAHDNMPTIHRHAITSDSNIPAYRGFQYVMRLY